MRRKCARRRLYLFLILTITLFFPDFRQIRDAAVGSVVATEGALYRAKRKRCPNITTYQQFLSAENRAMQFTEQGAVARVGEEHFEEMLLLYGGMLVNIAKLMHSLPATFCR